MRLTKVRHKPANGCKFSLLKTLLLLLLTISGSYNRTELWPSPTLETSSQNLFPNSNDPLKPCIIENNYYRYNPLLFSITKPYDNSHTCPASLLSVTWSHPTSQNSNKLSHSLTGNKRIGYKIGFWNCRKGIVSDSILDTSKLTDVKQFVQKHNPHLFGIIESDLHGLNSFTNNRKKFSSEEIQRKLHIDGYRLLLPSSWQRYGLARVMMYIKDEVHHKLIKVKAEDEDLQSMSVEIGLGKERKTIINLFYREWTGGISKLNNQASQLERQKRMVEQWRNLNHGRKKDIIILGDANLCAKKNGME